ncbi:MAG: hypothetical protein H0V78_09965, partial [Burkholderiales bacterium]|nr:hypothetical protein [Burkholderiales bacterium]
MQEWKERRHHEFEAPCLQENGAADELPTEMVVSASRCGIESRKSAEGKLDPAFVQKLVGAVPDSDEAETHAVLRKKIQVEIEDRFFRGCHDVSAANLIFLVGTKAEPHISDELTLFECAQ